MFERQEEEKDVDIEVEEEKGVGGARFCSHLISFSFNLVNNVKTNSIQI